MQPEKTPRDRAEHLIRLLFGWWPTPQQGVWVIRLAVVLVVLIAIGHAYDVTLLDWLKLLIVPAVIAGVGIWFNRQQRERELKTARQQREKELDIAERRTQDEALQAYLDQMSGMLIPATDQPSLYKARPGDSLSEVARARTLTVLRRLDGKRKARVVQFLYESGLIVKDHQVLTLSRADLSDTLLFDLNLRGVALDAVNLERANLSGADLSGANLSRLANLSSANLSRAILSSAILSNRANLSGANLSGANLSGARLPGANLSGADLSRAILSGADLSRAILSSAELSSAGLDSANLSRAELPGAHLPSANLSRARLPGANLSGADLSGADLLSAILSDTNIPRRANLSGANLSGARVPSAILSGAYPFLEGATMPNGQKYEDWLKDKEDGKETGEDE